MNWWNRNNSNNTDASQKTASSSMPIGSEASSMDPTSALRYASNSVNYAAEQAYSSLAGAISSFYTSSFDTGLLSLASLKDHGATDIQQQQQQQPQQQQQQQQQQRLPPIKKHPISIGKYPELMSWIVMNPYSSVRGRHHHPSSMSAVRSLLTLVPMEQRPILQNQQRLLDPQKMGDSLSHHRQTSLGEVGEVAVSDGMKTILETDSTIWDSSLLVATDASTAAATKNKNLAVSNAETASQLAEGTLRALRDITLDEAMELHGALRYWTERWENPLLSWLEAGPWVWFSKEGYNHQQTGRNVSEIQAVLARRCSAIGELQQHLLRAGWQRGVAQWGCLGEGGHWAAVAGFDSGAVEKVLDNGNIPFGKPVIPWDSRDRLLFSKDEAEESHHELPPTLDYSFQSPGTLKRTISNLGDNAGDINNKKEGIYGYGNVFVTNASDGRIFTDNSSLADWSIDAILLVRTHLNRAAKGRTALPLASNWSETNKYLGKAVDHGESIILPEADILTKDDRPFPSWADRQILASEDLSRMTDDADIRITDSNVVISNIPLLAAEVTELLNSMEEIMDIQRQRRMQKFRPPSWSRRNWYLSAMTAPTIGYFIFKMFRDGYGQALAKYVVEKVGSFFKEHVSDPLASIYVEIFKGRENISDREARMVAIFTLKKMIRSWLDETYPNMPEEEKAHRAEIMDISLLEEKKEQNMKSLYEINSVIRMSFIEMQFIKKELLNALIAIDDMVRSNEINMNLAAVTPAVLLIYLAQRGVKFLLYALLKIGKSRDETYATFRQIVLDIERLLIMRHAPPSVPPPLTWGSKAIRQDSLPATWRRPKGDTLSADDLGMLMLHIHECRTILWQDRNRFSSPTIRNLAEDLAELAGERGAVSIEQQILIVGRMGRTYPFLKVLSTGTPFQLSRIHSKMV